VNRNLTLAALAAFAALPSAATASSHMDAPLIVLDDAANTTDVYAFVSRRGAASKYLTTALSVYPFEEPGIGPNKYGFDDKVLYAIHLSLGGDVATGRRTISYFFQFKTRFKNKKTILQAYTGVIQNVDDAAQNLTQDYDVYVGDTRPSGMGFRLLGSGVVPPNNQGIATPEYNLAAGTVAGEGPAKDGVASAAQLDRYTAQSIKPLDLGHVSFCGQREDAFYGDIQAIFDLLSLRGPGAAKDAQGGYNVHTLVLQIPLDQIGGDMQTVGVHATTYREQIKVSFDNQDPITVGTFIQVGRQGNPLFCEGFVAIEDKDAYNRTAPDQDARLFKKYADTPELAALLNALIFKGNVAPTNNRSDLVGIFIPDVIKVDLSTPPVRLPGGGTNHPTTPDDAGYSRLSVFGGDTLFSALANGQVPGGWPNGRRFGDDVVDIGVTAVASDLRTNPPVIRVAGDNVDKNDAVYNKVMPYAGTPHNGRNHPHH
jgi:hypothetical protein